MTEGDTREALRAWFEENLTYENFRDWDDAMFADALLRDFPHLQPEPDLCPHVDPRFGRCIRTDGAHHNHHYVYGGGTQHAPQANTG